METIFGYNQTKQIIPHRQPFLLIDKVVRYEESRRCVAIKQVSRNRPFFRGHFPEHAVMPGVLITETLTQTGTVAILNSEGSKGKVALFAGVDKYRFKRQVIPGDASTLEVEITKIKGPVDKDNVKATVDGRLACSCELTSTVQGIK